MSEAKVIVITGGSSGFGNLSARALARVGHTVYAGMRATTGRNAAAAAELAELSAAEHLDVRGIEMDVQDQDSVDAVIGAIIGEQGRIDVVVHNAGHMVLGPAEAFTPEQLAELYDVNVLSTQRVNRAVLPVLRQRESGLLVWVGSSSTRGGHPPFLGPYFAAKAGMDALAESHAAELVKFGIDTVIVVPGAYTSGTNHFAHAGQPADTDRAAAYDRNYGQLRENMADSLTAIFPAGHDAREVADEIVRVVDLPAGQRPSGPMWTRAGTAVRSSLWSTTGSGPSSTTGSGPRSYCPPKPASDNPTGDERYTVRQLQGADRTLTAEQKEMIVHHRPVRRDLWRARPGKHH